MDNSTSNMSEKLLQYLDGGLAGVEKENIEQQLATDPSLQAELESLKETREALKLYGLKQKVSGIHQQMMTELQTPVKKTGLKRRIIRYSMAAAASIILIAGGIFLYSFLSVSPGKVFSSNYRSYELSTMRDGDTQQVSSVEKAYREKDYTKAIEAYTPNPSTTIKDNFLAAMSYIELGNSKDAIELFKKVLEQDELQKSNFLKDESEYYLALSYIRNKEPKTALELLRKIKDNPNHLYHEKITSKLIRQVKMLKWR